MAISGEKVISPSMNSKATIVVPTDHPLTSEGNLPLKHLVCSYFGYYDQNNSHFPTDHPLRAEGKWKINDGNNDVEQGLCIQWLYYEPTYMRTLNSLIAPAVDWELTQEFVFSLSLQPAGRMCTPRCLSDFDDYDPKRGKEYSPRLGMGEV